jgi:TetR/AcrR family transcriptional repressor of mexJK operon
MTKMWNASSEFAGRKPAAKPKRKRKNLAGRPTAAELDRRKALVMDVATELFVERGYAATSLVDIARGAGVATRTLYQHFGDKEAIFREVIFARDEGAALERPAVLPGDTLFDTLKRAGRYAYDVTYREKSIGLMRLMIAESNRFPDFMKTVAISIFARFRRNIEKVFEQLEAAGLIPPGDHARSAELYSDLVLGSHPIMTYTNWDAAPPTDADLEDRVTLFIAGRFGSAVAKVARTKQAKLKAAD